MDTKFLAGAGFLRGRASLTAAIPWDRARGILYFSHNFLFKRRGVICFFAFNTICRNAARLRLCAFTTLITEMRMSSLQQTIIIIITASSLFFP